jgi:hypothetical protein
MSRPAGSASSGSGREATTRVGSAAQEPPPGRDAVRSAQLAGGQSGLDAVADLAFPEQVGGEQRRQPDFHAGPIGAAVIAPRGQAATLERAPDTSPGDP